MNKQEVIEKLEEKKSSFNAWEHLVRNRALDDALDIVRKLDEPEKPVVPQFVADFYEAIKNDFENKIYGFCVDFYLKNLDEKIYDWFEDQKNNHKPIETLVLMHKLGYEVEKEKLYTAMLKISGEYLRLDCEGNFGHFKVDFKYFLDGTRAYQFTEDDLVKYHIWGNDNYEVKEVEE